MLARFEEMFSKYDTDHDNALNKAEIDFMLDDRKESFVGRQASGAEFGLLLRLGGEETAQGRALTRERLASFYDGSLFYRLAGESVPE